MDQAFAMLYLLLQRAGDMGENAVSDGRLAGGTRFLADQADLRVVIDFEKLSVGHP